MAARIWTATADDFIRILRGLLPKGLVWVRTASSRLTRHLEGMAEEFVRVHNSGSNLMEEADPQTTSDMLEDWERVLGLPEFEYSPTEVDERRNVVVGKLASTGGQSAAYFEALAARYGVTDCVVENTDQLFVWVARSPTAFMRARCTSPCDSPLFRFLETDGLGVDEAVAGSELFAESAGRPVFWAFEKYKPVHTRIFWTD